uniref:Uncharacterized protein n=1 Tax=Trieres chinensis TaxID=1514140 RepID=A0A7S1ZT43_TRICV
MKMPVRSMRSKRFDGLGVCGHSEISLCHCPLLISAAAKLVAKLVTLLCVSPSSTAKDLPLRLCRMTNVANCWTTLCWWKRLSAETNSRTVPVSRAEGVPRQRGRGWKGLRRPNMNDRGQSLVDMAAEVAVGSDVKGGRGSGRSVP